MAVTLLDSSVVAAFLDADDILHQVAATAVAEAASQHSLVVSVVTVAEVLTGAKLGHQDERAVRRFFTKAVTEQLPLDEETAERAAELRAKNQGLRMPDALILATADLSAAVALTADRRLARAIGAACQLILVAPPGPGSGPRAEPPPVPR